MDLLFIKLLVHLRNQESKEAVDLVVANPIMITFEDDELHLSPLHHALFNKAPFNIISTFVSHWLLLKDWHSLTEMELVHLACKHHATFNVIPYLSALFPDSWKTKNSNGYTPFMIALSKQLDEDILYILDISDIGSISDFCSLGVANHEVVNVYFEEDYKRIDLQKMLFQLEHKDPTLKCLILSDAFHSLYPEEKGGYRNHSKHRKAVMDVLDAVKFFPNLDQLVLMVDHEDSILWREGETPNTLFSVMHNLPSKVIIVIRLVIASFDPVAEMMKHCPNVKYLLICVAGWAPYGTGTVALVRSLSDLPVLESLTLERWNLSRREALLLHVCLMKKKSLKSICMVGTRMSEYVASKMLQIYKDSDECNQLEFLSFFGNTSSLEKWQEQWQEDIDLQLEELAHINHTRRSVSDFMNKINSRENSSNGSNEELQFMNNILDANDKDSEDGYEYDWISRPDHLYMLIQSKPDYIQRCVNLEREYSVSNKRQKII
jgi:ankyrin repeat protein